MGLDGYFKTGRGNSISLFRVCAIPRFISGIPRVSFRLAPEICILAWVTSILTQEQKNLAQLRSQTMDLFQAIRVTFDRSWDGYGELEMEMGIFFSFLLFSSLFFSLFLFSVIFSRSNVQMFVQLPCVFMKPSHI